MIDSTLFTVDLPAGSYAAGDVVEFTVHTGPSVVRDGRGRAILKQVMSGMLGTVSGSTSSWRFFIQNSDWVDPMCNHPGFISDVTAFSDESSNIQSGCDVELIPNSGWRVWGVCIANITTTVANTLFVLIDIDYPSNGGVVNPDTIQGIPASIQYDDNTSENLYALGAAASATWKVRNVDNFKAGYKYTLQKISIITGGQNCIGFIALANAAGMAGLTRIIPVTSSAACVRKKIRYASILSKGPMDVRTLLFVNAGTAATATWTYVNADWVKKKV